MKAYNTLALLICLNIGMLFGQTNTTLVKSLATGNQKFISFNLNEHVDVQQWDKDYIRVEIAIASENVSEKILKRLISLGRYEIEVDRHNMEMILEMPKTKHIVMISGKNLDENISYKVMVPKGMISKVNNTTALAAN